MLCPQPLDFKEDDKDDDAPNDHIHIQYMCNAIIISYTEISYYKNDTKTANHKRTKEWPLCVHGTRHNECVVDGTNGYRFL